MPEENAKKVRVTIKDISDLVQDGMPLTCATCVHLHESRAKGIPTCGKDLCGGPLLGRDFPEYRGQLSRERLATICLMCGNSLVSNIVLIPGKSSRFALCEAHAKTYDNVLVNLPGVIQIQPIVLPVK